MSDAILERLVAELVALRSRVGALERLEAPGLPASIDADTLDGLHAAESGADAHVLATNDKGGAQIDEDLRIGGGLVVGSTSVDPAAEQIVQGSGGNCIRAVFTKVGIADNVATTVFTVSTTNESAGDAGGYSCYVRALVGHNVVGPGAGASAVKSFIAHFGCVLRSSGASVHSAVVKSETASATHGSASRDIGSTTLIIAPITDYQRAVQFLIDLTGADVTSAQVVADVELLWHGFKTPPVLAAG